MCPHVPTCACLWWHNAKLLGDSETQLVKNTDLIRFRLKITICEFLVQQLTKRETAKMMRSATVIADNGDRLPKTKVLMTFPKGTRGWAKCVVHHDPGNPSKFCTQLLIAAMLSPQRCFPSTPQSCSVTVRDGVQIPWSGVANFSLWHGFLIIKVGYGNMFVTTKEGTVLYILPSKEEAHAWFDPYAASTYAYGCCDAQGAPTPSTFAVDHGPPSEGVMRPRLWQHRNCYYITTDGQTVPCLVRSIVHKYSGETSTWFGCKRNRDKIAILEWRLIPIGNEQQLARYPGF